MFLHLGLIDCLLIPHKLVFIIVKEIYKSLFVPKLNNICRQLSWSVLLLGTVCSVETQLVILSLPNHCCFLSRFSGLLDATGEMKFNQEIEHTSQNWV